MNVDIKFLNSTHTEKIKNLHIECLPNDFLSILGDDFLVRYYTNLFEQKKSIIIGAFSNDELIAMVAYCSKDWNVIDFVKNNTLFFLKICISNIWSIKFIKYFIEVLIISGIKIPKSEYELLYIFVANQFKGKSLGSKLLSAGLRELSIIDNQFNVLVKTLNSTPENVCFYKKNNFKIVKESFGRVWLKYTNQ